jgi:preprotein translocase subunit YajC
MKYAEVRRGDTVWMATGECGRVVSKSNGTVYVQLEDGRFERLLVADVYSQAALSSHPDR